MLSNVSWPSKSYFAQPYLKVTCSRGKNGFLEEIDVTIITRKWREAFIITVIQLHSESVSTAPVFPILCNNRKQFKNSLLNNIAVRNWQFWTISTYTSVVQRNPVFRIINECLEDGKWSLWVSLNVCKIIFCCFYFSCFGVVWFVRPSQQTL